MTMKAEQAKDAMLRKTGEELIAELRKQWPDYDKWANFQWGWWKREDKTRWPRFDGQGEARFPYIPYSGRHSGEPPDGIALAASTNAAWFNSLYLLWEIMHDQLGLEKANEIMGYLWLAQASSIVKLVGRLEEKDRNCLALGRMYQQELYIEGCDLDVLEESPGRFAFRILCNWWRHVAERWKEKGIGFEDMGLCKPCIACCEAYGRAIHPDISCTCTAHPLNSGSYCELVYEMKGK